jgi:predicted ATPase
MGLPEDPDYPTLDELWELEAARVRSVEIVNYRSIKGTKVELLPFTVLAGANGAGKSNIVDVFRFVSEALSLGLYAALERRGGIQAVRHKVPSGGGRLRTIELKFLLNFPGGISAEYQFRLISGARGSYRVGEERVEMWTPDGHQFALVHLKNGDHLRKPLLLTVETISRNESFAEYFGPRFGNFGKEILALPFIGSHPAFMNVYRALREMRAYAIVPDLLREPQDPDEGFVLHADGRNASSVWQELGSSEKRELIAMLGHAVPGVEEVKTLRYGRKRGFEFLQAVGASKRISFEGHQMSDGTLRLFGIILGLLQPRGSSVVAIEEPEASLHVGALEALIELMRSRVGPGEIILTTHSPDLIDFVKPKELRLVRRDHGNTVVSEVSKHSKRMVREELFSLGELHRAGGLRAEDEPTSVPPES